MIECLETRRLLAVTAGLQGGFGANGLLNNLNIRGDDLAQVLTFVVTSTQLTVRNAGAHLSGPHQLSKLFRINITLLGGNDRVDATNVPIPLRVAGGRGNDLLLGGSANDTLEGEDNNDTISGGPGGNDLVNGGRGDADVADFSSRGMGVSVSLDGVANDGDRINPANTDNIGVDVEIIWGGSGNDSLTGSTANNTIRGGGGSDTIVGRGGIDAADYSDKSASQPVTADLDGVRDDGVAGERDQIATDVEMLIGGNGNDSLTGNGLENTLRGGPGSDTLIGGGGSDTADYGDKNSRQNVIASLDGVRNDGVAGEQDFIAADIENLTGGGGNDSLTGNAGPNVFIGNGGADTISGGPGIDLVDYSGAASAVFVTLDVKADDGTAGEGDLVRPDVERVVGSGFNDSIRVIPSAVSSPVSVTLIGGAGADLLVGGNGSDVLVGGGGGIDSMSGGNGNDFFINQDGQFALIDGGNGLDYAQESPEDSFKSIEFVYDRLTNNRPAAPATPASPPFTRDQGIGPTAEPPLEPATASAAASVVGGILTISGTSSADTIRISQSSTTFTVSINGVISSHPVAGVTGITISCNSGNDTVNLVDNPSKPVTISATIKGQGGNDTITGGNGPDALLGGASNDSLLGGPGDDVLNGSDPSSGSAADGTDFFSGGTGIDVLDYSIRTDALKITLGATTTNGATGENDRINNDIERVVGGSGNDSLVGDGLDNLLSGGAGRDTLIGNSGTDLLNVQCTGDKASTLVDLASGGDGNDIFTAADGVRDDLTGGPGFDTRDSPADSVDVVKD